MAILIAWAVLFFGVLTLPQYIPSPWNAYLAVIITLVAIVFSIVYFLYIKRPKPKVTVIEPEIKMHGFFETLAPNQDLVRFDYHIKAGEKHIPALEVQVSHGYGEALMWPNLDLRRDTFEQARTGKPIKRISLIPFQEYWFTFVAIHALSQQGSMKTIDPPPEVPFDNISWKTPYPEVYIRFLGLRKQIEQVWVVRFNPPPWILNSNLPVDLFPIDSPEAKALIEKRERQAGRETSVVKYTIISGDPNVGMSISRPSSEDTQEKKPKN